MTTITINIPDSSSAIISDIESLVKNAGGNISVYSDEDFSENELRLLKESYREALLIKDGKLPGIPASELWDE